MCPIVWREIGLGDSPSWLLHTEGAGGRDLISNNDMGFGTGVMSLLSSGDLALRVVEELEDHLPRIMVSTYYLFVRCRLQRRGAGPGKLRILRAGSEEFKHF